MLHAQGANEWGVGFDDNVMTLAESSDVGARVERVDLDLIDGGRDSWLRVQKLLKLQLLLVG